MSVKPVKLLFFLILCFLTSALFGFGKNKVQYKNFTWYYIQSKHFDVYFYEGGQEIAEFTAEIAEDAYVQINRDWRFDIKERIVFVVYNSHNDWQQTNVVISYLEEGIGGVTELYKNRIVVPFEGSYEQFRHVIHHELVHAVMNDMLYGGSVQSLLYGEVAQAPLWFSEGIAEFQSEGWTTQHDMIVRDAVLNGYMPDLRALNYYLVYQGGASVFKFIAQTYGRKKVGEMLHKMRGKVVFERVLQSSVGVGYDEFTQKWHRYLRKQYWPEVVERKEPVEIAKQMTFHDRVPNYLNVSPTISPNGDKIAFLSDRRGTQSVYVMSAVDGKIINTVIKGQRSESFEELHWLRPGMSFSPDGKKLVLTAKSGEKDAIYIADIRSGDTEKFELNLDGAFTTSWSPDGEKVAFVGNNSQQSDIFIIHLQDGRLEQLTDDIFTDDQPSWSADSKQILFVSDRKNYLRADQIPSDFNMVEHDYATRDVYMVDVTTREVIRITDTPWQESNPIFSPDGKTIAYCSMKNGISNLFLHPRDGSVEPYAVTDIISGIFQINWDRNANKMVFTTFYRGGFDIFVLNNPLEAKPVELTDTQFVTEMNKEKLPVYARTWEPDESDAEEEDVTTIAGNSAGGDYSKFVFSNLNQRPAPEPKEVELADETYQDNAGNYKIRKYKLKFSPDLVTGQAGYNTFFGFSGYTTFAFSDLLGDHKIFLNVNLVSDLKNSDLNLLYLNLRRRMSFGFGGYHQAWFRRISGTSIFQRYRNYGFTALTSYPFSKFSRMELSLNWYNIVLEYLTEGIPDQRVSTILPSVSYVHDSVLWGYTGPVDGKRYAVSLLSSPSYGDDSPEFSTLNLDYRKYLMINRDYNFAFRFAGGASFGDDKQRFFLGGIDNWLNYDTRGGLRTNSISDVFFSQFATPLRGAIYYERIGTRYMLTNLEFRFPMIQYLGLGFPPIRFFNIRGVMFADIGTTFNEGSNWYSADSWRGTHINEEGRRSFKDLVGGYGVGARVFLLYFLLRIDVAWPYNLDRSGKPIWYFSLGADL